MSADAKPLRRWEYMFIDCGDRQAFDDVFNPDVMLELDAAGLDGWEAVAVASNRATPHRILLKREVQS